MFIRPTLACDLPAVDALLDRCFGPARRNRTASVVRRDAELLPSACYVAESHGVIVGSVAVHSLFWVSDAGYTAPVAWLGPLVSDPDYRGRSIGLELMDSALTTLDRQSLPVALIGDAPYYRRWGFMADATQGWRLPGPVDRSRLLLRTANHLQFTGPACLMANLPAARAA